MPDCLDKIVDYLLNGANDKAFIEIQSKKKMHSYSDSEWVAVIYCNLSLKQRRYCKTNKKPCFNT